MTISNQTNRTSAVGSGSTGQEVAFSFPIAATSDLTVISRVTATGVATNLSETTDYTVSISGDTGGTLTTVTAVATTAEIHIIRSTPFTQSLDLEAGGSFNAENVEDGIDKPVKLAIENKDNLTRALRAPATDSSSLDMIIPNSIDRASKNLGFDSGGNVTVTDSSGTFTTATAIWDDVTMKGPWIDVRAFGATGDGTTNDSPFIELAESQAGANGTLLFPEGTYRVSDSLTFVAGVSLQFLGGAKFSVDSGKTVTIATPRNIIASPNQQIMSGSGLLKWSDRGGKVYAEWWGIDQSADATEINAAIQSFSGVNKGGWVQLLDKTYVLGAKILIDVAGTILRGMGSGATILSQSAAAITVDITTAPATISDFQISQNVGSQDAVKSTGHFVNIDNIRIVLPVSQDNNIGIHLFNGFQTRIRTCDITGDNNGLGTDSGNIGIKLEGACQNTSIRDCTIANISGDYGILVARGSGGASGGSILIDGCDVENIQNLTNSAVGIGVGEIFGCWITHCHMEGIKGLSVQAYGANAYGANLYGGTARGFMVSAGLDINATNGLQITDNYFQFDSGGGIKLDDVEGFRIRNNVIGGASPTFDRLVVTSSTSIASTTSDFMMSSPAGILDLYNESAGAQTSVTYVDVTDAPAVSAPVRWSYAQLVVTFTASAADVYKFKYSDDSTPIEATVTTVGSGTAVATAEGVFDGPGTGVGKLQGKSEGGGTWIIQKAYMVFY